MRCRGRNGFVLAAALLVAGSPLACEASEPAPTPRPSALDAERPGSRPLLDLVRIEAGRFVMGSPPGETGRDADEVRHEVALSRPYWIAATETTQAQWRAVVGSAPAYFTACGDDCPVERVSWFDAVEFANRLSAREGLGACYRLAGCRGEFGGGCPGNEDWCHGDFRCDTVELVSLDCPGYRLPTEAEWERASRAGTDAATWIGAFTIEDLNSAPALDPIAWYGGNSGVDYRPAWDCSDWSGKQFPADWCGPHAVAAKASNPWGLYDVLGNVWEWTWDWKASYPESPVADPTGPAQGEYRVRRGCSWSNIPDHCRAADRSDDAPEMRDRNWGFRVARTAL